jgi:hypothetical protein
VARSSLRSPALPLALGLSIWMACGGGDGDQGGGPDGAGAGGGTASADAGRDPDCWPGGGAPGGQVEIGTPDPFVPLQDEGAITLVIGPQGGVHIDAQSRVRGMAPGNLHDPFDPANPYTLFSVHDEQDNSLSAILCAFRTPYRGDGAEPDDPLLLRSPIVLFLDHAQVSPFTAADRIGTRLRVGVEVIDAEGRHASDAHWVIVTEVTEGPGPH